MASGKSIELRDFTRSMKWRRSLEREARERDRSLRGKARRRARRMSNTTTT